MSHVAKRRGRAMMEARLAKKAPREHAQPEECIHKLPEPAATQPKPPPTPLSLHQLRELIEAQGGALERGQPQTRLQTFRQQNARNHQQGHPPNPQSYSDDSDGYTPAKTHAPAQRRPPEQHEATTPTIRLPGIPYNKNICHDGPPMYDGYEGLQLYEALKDHFIIKQNPGQTALAYFFALETAENKAREAQLTQAELDTWRFICGLRAPIRERLLGEPYSHYDTREKAVGIATRIEHQSYGNNFYANSEASNKKNKKSLYCRYCNRHNHSTKNCRKKPRQDSASTT